MLHEQIKGEIKEAMKAKDQLKLSVVRALVTAFMNEAVTKGKGPDGILSDEEALAVIKRAANQRKDAINQFTEGGRPELAEGEKAELAILEAYLPTMMSREEIKPIVQAKIAEFGVTDKSGAGKLTGAIMADLKGKADGGDVKAIVDELLG
ncbi:MAG TPA: GatB/YqeY domain-containing protein [Candidatus Paceibacterota bacterium]|nr:GatB/YqeY domain-containing protein [Candidatus Paceibacterota bacterium]